MRIEQFQPPSVKSAEEAQPGDKSAEAHGQLAAAAHADQVALSRLSQALIDGVADSARLEELRVQVAEGAYHVPAADLSQRLVDSLLRGEE